MSRRTFIRFAAGGVSDAGLASLATFAVGLAAARLLTPTDLGVYAIFFTAFLTGTEIPARGVFAPAEVLCVAHPVGQRTRVLRSSLRAGAIMAFASTAAMLAATAVSWQITSLSTVTALTVTSMVAAYLSPIQDHVRRVFIKDGASWYAALISGVQVASVTAAITALWVAPIDVAWVPFGGLALGNLVSLTFGLVLVRRAHVQPLPGPITLRSLASSGRYLVVSQLVPTGAAFLAAAIISRLAGAAELGYAEAARLAAQPVLVAALGLAAVFEPRFMEAAGRRDRRRAQGGRQLFYGLLAGLGALYLAIGGWPWMLNPMAYLVPEAYAVPWLVALYVVANLANGATYAAWGELAGGGFESRLAKASSAASGAWPLAAATAGATGAFARPLGLLLQSVTRHVLYVPLKERMYGTPPVIVDDPHRLDSAGGSVRR